MATTQANGLTANSGAVASSSTSAASTSSTKPAVQPSEVGWLFVPQYYTFLNQNPGRLHCFYTKKSTLVHGVEQEDEKPCFGQQEIHDRITSLGFQDCKVYVSNVDSQSSASGGIIIQVLGEMSNKAGPWRKFAQTFFLAEQPLGYFVLNDIFRYLKDDEETEEQAEEIDEDLRKDEAEAREENRDVVGAQVDISAIAQPGATPHVQPVISSGSQEQPSVAAIAAAPTDTSAAAAAEQPAVEEAAATVPEPDAQPIESASDAAAAAVEPEAPAAPEAQPEATPAPAAAKKPEQPAAPPKPKTWAGLAASNVSVWGSNVRSDAKGVSSSKPSTPAATTPTPRSAAAAPASQQPRSSGGANGSTVDPSSVFIKNVQAEHVTEAALRTALTQAFGPVKNVSILANRGIAYADFHSAESGKKAVAQNALIVGDKGWRVNIEEKKPRPDARGGPGGAGGQRGSFRGGASGGRGGGAGRGSGAAGRGGKMIG